MEIFLDIPFHQYLQTFSPVKISGCTAVLSLLLIHSLIHRPFPSAPLRASGATRGGREGEATSDNSYCSQLLTNPPHPGVLWPGQHNTTVLEPLTLSLCGDTPELRRPL